MSRRSKPLPPPRAVATHATSVADFNNSPFVALLKRENERVAQISGYTDEGDMAKHQSIIYLNKLGISVTITDYMKNYAQYQPGFWQAFSYAMGKNNSAEWEKLFNAYYYDFRKDFAKIILAALPPPSV